MFSVLSLSQAKETAPRRRTRTPSALARAPRTDLKSAPRTDEDHHGPCEQGRKKRACGTTDSHVVPHRSTEVACSGLTSQIGRDTVRFTEYGRRRPTPRSNRAKKVVGIGEPPPFRMMTWPLSLGRSCIFKRVELAEDGGGGTPGAAGQHLPRPGRPSSLRAELRARDPPASSASAAQQQESRTQKIRSVGKGAARS